MPMKVPNKANTDALKAKLDTLLTETFGAKVPGFALFCFFEGKDGGLVCLTDAPNPLMMAKAITPYLAAIAQSADVGALTIDPSEKKH